MRNTSGCIAVTVVPFEVAGVGVASLLMSGFGWVSLIVGMVVGSLAWLIVLFALFGGKGDETRDG